MKRILGITLGLFCMVGCGRESLIKMPAAEQVNINSQDNSVPTMPGQVDLKNSFPKPVKGMKWVYRVNLPAGTPNISQYDMKVTITDTSNNQVSASFSYNGYSYFITDKSQKFWDTFIKQFFDIRDLPGSIARHQSFCYSTGYGPVCDSFIHTPAGDFKTGYIISSNSRQKIFKPEMKLKSPEKATFLYVNKEAGIVKFEVRQQMNDDPVHGLHEYSYTLLKFQKK